MIRLIFVGLHNKPPLMPLDVKSSSGKRLQSAIDLLDYKEGEIVKTNLFDVDYLPKDKKEIVQHGEKWLNTYKPESNDIIVLFGVHVQHYFPPTGCIVINHNHPSPLFAKDSEAEYAHKLAKKIIYALAIPPSSQINTVSW